MESPTGLMPEELIRASKKNQALDYLRAQPWPGDFKRQVLRGWAKVTGAAVAPYEENVLAASGFDNKAR